MRGHSCASRGGAVHRGTCLLALVVGLVVAASAAGRVAAQAPLPRLVVLLVVDQMRADYVERFGGQWTGGLARLLGQGARFTHAAYPFANTVTCAGHASISTGTLPAAHGLIMNTWWDRDFGRAVACTDDPAALALSYGRPLAAAGQSAARLLRPTLADEMRRQLPLPPRVAAFSIKARSAISLAGQQPDAIAWVADEGAWATSTAFPRAELNDAVARFIDANPVEHRLWTTWAAARADAARTASAPVGAGGERLAPFPHPVRTWDEWEASPLSDEYLAEMALEVAGRGRLGADGRTDYLAISFSALDLVGHTYGPDSAEVQDVLLRLDRTIGTLLDGLDRSVGRENYVVALTADHGVAPIPEQARADRGLAAGRIPARAVLDAAQKALASALGPGRWVNRLMNGELYLDPVAVERLRDMPSAARALTQAILEVPGVERVYPSDRIGRDPAGDVVLQQIANGFVPSRSGDVVIVFKPYWLVGTANNANHGTAHDYDQHVPVVLAGPGIRRGTYETPITPLDIAPTLARLMGITMPHATGRILVEALTPAHQDETSHR